MRLWTVSLVVTLVTVGNVKAQSFVNWESPHVNPMDMTPDSSRLLAVNTADNRLEVFLIQPQGLQHAGSVPVGLDPISVRARSDSEAWVVNHISDTVSVVDLNAMNVTATLHAGDEPTDVVFAGDPARAFVSVSQLNQIKVYEPDDLGADPVVLDIAGEDPRALATDGDNVYAAIFESGNNSTILAQTVVSSSVNPYPGDANPPPNNGASFEPPIAGGLPTPPDVSLIVRKDNGNWLDDNNGDWSAAVTWDLHDHDVAIVDADTLSVSYVSGLMNADMNLGVRPNGDVVVIGTDGTNQIRFEPNVRGTFVHMIAAVFTPPAATASVIADLNPHLDYSNQSVAQEIRDQSIGDPRGIDFSTVTSRTYITGMGSNNLIAYDDSFNVVAAVEVGQGPTSAVVDDSQDAVYVLNKFEGTISVIDQTALSEIQRIGFYDPTPEVIRIGRPHLYDTHKNSGLGQASCASCHIDGRMDQLAWDLGAPDGAVKPFNQVCNFGVGGCEDWHPMKGPMTTQTLVGIIGTEPFHWRGDREDLAAFNVAFEGLLGDDVQLTSQEMTQFTDFVATLTTPPNPNRNIDNTLKTSMPNGGNPVSGENLYNNIPLDGGAITCVTCHALPAGTNGQLTSGPLLQETQSLKIPQLRNMYEKTGFAQASSNNNRGFGFIHDGSIDSLFEFLQFGGFTFAGGETGNQQRRDVEAFLFSFGTDTHAGVGAQATVGGAGGDQTALRDDLLSIAESGVVGMVVKGLLNGEQRGLYYLGGGSFQSDRAVEVFTTAELDTAALTAPLTYTLVPAGSQQRMGIDRDEDGFFDQDELDVCADPADPLNFPGSNTCVADLTGGAEGGDGQVDASDLALLLAAWGNSGSAADLNCDGTVGTEDLALLLGAWGSCP